MDPEEKKTPEGQEPEKVNEESKTDAPTPESEEDKKEVTVSVKDLKELLGEKKALSDASGKALERRVKAQKKFNLSGAPADKAVAMKAQAIEDMVMFVKAIGSKDENALLTMSDARAKRMNTGTGSAGGFLVPEEFENTVIRFAKQYGVVRRNASTLPMKSDTLRLNTLVTEPVVTIVGEGVAIEDTTSLAFGEPVLTPKKYVAIVDYTSELLEDSEIDIVNQIAERIAIAMALKEDTEFFDGATSGSEGLAVVSGITSSGMATGDDSGADVTFDYLAALQTAVLNAIDDADSDSYKYYMHRSTYNVLQLLKGTDSHYYLPEAPSNAMKPTIWGRPVVISNRVNDAAGTSPAEKVVMFADLKKNAWIGDRRGMRVKIFDTGTVNSGGTAVNLLEEDSEAIRVTKRTAFATALQAGIGWLVTGATS